MELCIHRSVRPVGKLKCSCSNAPEVYRCNEPWVESGFCLPVFSDIYSEGLIVSGGEQISPSDDRMKKFVPWVLKEGETPQSWQVIACSRCAKKKEPTEAVSKLMRFGVQGAYDGQTGCADVLSLYSSKKMPHRRVLIPERLRHVQVDMGGTQAVDLNECLRITACMLVIVYESACSRKLIEQVASENAGVMLWWIGLDASQPPVELPNVVCGLPQDLSGRVDEFVAGVYEEAATRVFEKVGIK